MLKKVGIGLLCAIAVLVVVIALQPGSFRIERSAQISAPPAVVFDQINDFHGWAAWSPWEKLDPGMKKEYSGPTAGAGAVYSWVGNDDVGEGRMTILESKPAERVVIRLEFIKPFAATNTTIFTVTPDGAGTKVNWAMEGTNDFMGKAFSLFMDMDKLVGKDFEGGLAALKGVSESEAKRRKETEAAPQAAQPAAAPAPSPAP